MKSCTYIDGVGSSQAIDTAGEIVDLKGLDISSLVGGAANYEHKSDLPAQIVGKVIEAHKIFSADDCQNERQLYFWNKTKIPFLYCIVRLFDDKKDSSREVAALVKDDAEHPNEQPMIGFSIEGAKLEKQGSVVTRSIARKLTLTNLPCNKQCIAELIPSPSKEVKDDFSSLFKGEMELFSFESSYIELLEKNEDMRVKVAAAQKEIKTPSWHSKVTHTSGQPISSGVSKFKTVFGKSDALDKGEDDEYKNWRQAANRIGAKKAALSRKINTHLMAGKNLDHPDVAEHWKNYRQLDADQKHLATMNPRKLKKAEDAPKYGQIKPTLSHEEMLKKPEEWHLSQKAAHLKHSQIKSGQSYRSSHAEKAHFQMGHLHALYQNGKYDEAKQKHASLSKEDSLEKALTAGSMMAAPGNLEGGAALTKESLDRKSQKVNSLNKKEKSEWYTKADEAYQSWSDREKFRGYMKKKLPHLADGEVDAIGRVLALKNTMKKEDNLSKMFASYYKKSEDLMKSRGRLTMPGMSNLTRPDQEVRQLSTPRQVNIGKKAYAAQTGDPKGEKFASKVMQGAHGVHLTDKEGKAKVSMAYAGANPSVTEHEGAHHLFSSVREKYGPKVSSKVAWRLAGHLHPEDKEHIVNNLVNVGGYDKNHPQFNEEVVNHVRDLLHNRKMRDVFFANNKNFSTNEDKQLFLTKLKHAWNNMRNDAKSYKPSMFKNEDEVEKAETGHEKGIHTGKYGSAKGAKIGGHYAGGGGQGRDYPQSSMGASVRHVPGSSGYPKDMSDQIAASHKKHTKQEVSRVRAEMKRMPDPKLPKSEDIEKTTDVMMASEKKKV